MNADNTSGLRDALDFVNRQPCRCMSIAQLGERDYCDRCQSVKNLRALLARTEAGADVEWNAHSERLYELNAAPVADGAVARLIRPAPLVSGTIQKFPTKTGATTVIPLEECLSLPPGEYLLYTRPQDASGDAEKDAEIARLNAIINSPQSDDFLRAVSTEAEHQRQRWDSDHDAGKAPADWFWLVGYLAGKALHSHAAGDTTKAEHHIITTAAACANWHRAMFGRTDMRPGIDGDAAMRQEAE